VTVAFENPQALARGHVPQSNGVVVASRRRAAPVRAEAGGFHGAGMTVEGAFKFTGGDGAYRGITGGGNFKTTMKSETELACSWEGSYELAKAQAR